MIQRKIYDPLVTVVKEGPAMPHLTRHRSRGGGGGTHVDVSSILLPCGDWKIPDVGLNWRRSYILLFRGFRSLGIDPGWSDQSAQLLEESGRMIDDSLIHLDDRSDWQCLPRRLGSSGRPTSKLYAGACIPAILPR